MTQPRRPPNPPRSVPTRLVGGPLLFRIVNPIRPPAPYEASILRYAMVFRLNRPHLHLPGDPDAPLELPRGSNTELGNVGVSYESFSYDSDLSNFDDADHPKRDGDNCFIGELRTSDGTDSEDDRVVVSRLDELPLGKRVPALIQPLTPAGSRGAKLGKTYFLRPVLQPMSVRAGDQDTVTIADPAAHHALLHIGCHATTFF